MNDPFEIVGVRPELLERQAPEKENRWYQGVPWLSVIVLLIIAGGCLFCKWIMPKDPSYMDLKNYTVAPCREFLFGTDTMGRDIFSMIWYGGRQSLFIGFVATMISTGIAIIFGTVSGLAPEWLDMLLMRMKKEDFEQVIDTNLVGTFNVTKNVVPYMMKARSGRIINISSVVGISGNAGQTNYSASKAGIIGFTKSLAKEIASRNILVNAVAPGFIETNMTDVLKDDVKQEIAKNIPLKRMGTTQDVANVVKFLASDDSSYITGQVINVDGGMLM